MNAIDLGEWYDWSLAEVVVGNYPSECVCILSADLIVHLARGLFRECIKGFVRCDVPNISVDWIK